MTVGMMAVCFLSLFDCELRDRVLA